MSDVLFKVTCISLFEIALSNLNNSCVRNGLGEKSKNFYNNDESGPIYYLGSQGQ